MIKYLTKKFCFRLQGNSQTDQNLVTTYSHCIVCDNTFTSFTTVSQLLRDTTNIKMLQVQGQEHLMFWCYKGLLLRKLTLTLATLVPGLEMQPTKSTCQHKMYVEATQENICDPSNQHLNILV